MTTITIMKSKNGNYKQVTCKGHAGYADSGSDIVCAAVSVLVINAVNSLEALTDTKMQVETDEHSGLIDLCFTEEIGNSGRLLMDSLILGLKNVAGQYGEKYVKLKFKEV